MKLLNEYKILIYCLEFLEKEGLTLRECFFYGDEKFLLNINNRFHKNINYEELQDLIKKNISHGHLERPYVGDSGVIEFRITERGLGIAKSKKKALQEYSETGFLKKLSDKVQAHTPGYRPSDPWRSWLYKCR